MEVQMIHTETIGNATISWHKMKDGSCVSKIDHTDGKIKRIHGSAFTFAVVQKEYPGFTIDLEKESQDSMIYKTKCWEAYSLEHIRLKNEKKEQVKTNYLQSLEEPDVNNILRTLDALVNYSHEIEDFAVLFQKFMDYETTDQKMLKAKKFYSGMFKH